MIWKKRKSLRPDFNLIMIETKSVSMIKTVQKYMGNWRFLEAREKMKSGNICLHWNNLKEYPSTVVIK